MDKDLERAILESIRQMTKMKLYFYTPEFKIVALDFYSGQTLGELRSKVDTLVRFKKYRIIFQELDLSDARSDSLLLDLGISDGTRFRVHKY